jgi:hypothetical protein
MWKKLRKLTTSRFNSDLIASLTVKDSEGRDEYVLWFDGSDLDGTILGCAPDGIFEFIAPDELEQFANDILHVVRRVRDNAQL